ncbi:unnamed protein product [Moneuplotes crassus]|uniref:Uncharacterized protein n=1 Tax=Euplotes crassus TaxID=5936 RepID=A0AAD1UMG5_EUPCR|nr:unnamed protein product [Moneuplotes crassus]
MQGMENMIIGIMMPRPSSDLHGGLNSRTGTLTFGGETNHLLSGCMEMTRRHTGSSRNNGSDGIKATQKTGGTSKVENLVNDKIQKVANDLTEKERALYDRIKVLKNTGQNDDIKKKRLKNKIKDQELQEDLRHNYVYQIMFENWKKKHKALAPYDGKEMKLPDICDDDRTRRDEWLEFDEEKLKFPSPEDINNMDIKDDFFDVDKLHELNVKRLKKLPRKMKDEDKRFKFDINLLDDKLFGKLDTERQQKETGAIQVTPMYSSKEQNHDGFGSERKIYANTLKSTGAFDSKLNRSPSQNIFDEARPNKFRDPDIRNSSVFNKDGDRAGKYKSLLKLASEMITS